MNSDAIVALISELYANAVKLTAENVSLREQLDKHPSTESKTKD